MLFTNAVSLGYDSLFTGSFVKHEVGLSSCHVKFFVVQNFLFRRRCIVKIYQYYIDQSRTTTSTPPHTPT